MLEITDNKLVYRYDAEEVWIEPWGSNALRVRATKENRMPEENWALCRREKSDGSDVLVAPVLYVGQKKRSVYLPKGMNG